MDKVNVIVSCPIDTYSGYGARARDFVKALIALEKYNVQILSQRWGNTSFGYLEDHNERELKSLIIPKVNQKPDVWIQITVPNEFQPVGKYNIGVTAGIETNTAAAPWIEGCNRMNLVLTSSEHSKKVFKNSQWDKADQSGNPLGKVSLTSDMEVLLEGLDTSKYYDTKGKSSFNLDNVKESFCFLFVGHWLQGDFGQDRKNVGYTIKSFLETFKNKQNQPALLLKTSISTSSHMNTDIMLRRIDEIRKTVKGKLPSIYLIDGDMADEDINNLYNHPKVKAMVCLTKGEGFGRPLLEFSNTNKPIITTGWSGHMDFLSKDTCVLVGGELKPVHPSAAIKDVLIPESSWLTPDDNEVARAYKKVYKEYKKLLPLAKKQGHRTRTEFTLDTMTVNLGEYLEKYIPKFPKQVELNLPTLNLPKLS